MGTNIKWQAHEERVVFSDGSHATRMASGIYGAWHLGKRCEVYLGHDACSRMERLADGYEAMLAFVRFAASLVPAERYDADCVRLFGAVA